MIVVIGASSDDTAGHHLLTEVGLGHDAELAAVGNEKRRDVLCAHQTGGFSDRSFRRTEHWRRCYKIADADGTNLRQAVNGVPSAGEPLAHGPGNEYGPGGPAENVRSPCSRPISVAGSVFMRPDGEGRRHASQQRRVAEALPGLEDVHHLVLVAQLDRAAADDEKLRRRGAVLDQNIGACGVGSYRYRRGDAQQIVPAKLIEWGKGARKSAISSAVPVVGRIPESTSWLRRKLRATTDGPKAIKKREGRRRSRCKGCISCRVSRARATSAGAASKRGTGANPGARPAVPFKQACAWLHGRATLVLDIDPVPIERQVGEQRRPAEPVIDLDIAELRVPEAAEQPEDEIESPPGAERHIS